MTIPCSRHLLALLILASVLASPSSAKKLVTIHEIECVTTETVTGPDKLYITAFDGKDKIHWNTAGVQHVNFKNLNNGQTWVLNHEIELDDDDILHVTVKDCDHSSLGNAIGLGEVVKEFNQKLSSNAEAKKPLAAGIAVPNTIVTALLVGVLTKANDPDDVVFNIMVEQKAKAGTKTVSQKMGKLITGSNSHYKMKYSVKVVP